jgi:NADH:ubiquinone oxidoreductase subunit C
MDSQANNEKIFFINVKPEEYLNAARRLREEGYERLLTVSAVDWMDGNEFEVYFIAYNPAENRYVKVSTRIPRDKPEIPKPFNHLGKQCHA